MTSRLKKRLGNLGVDAASARANESFCLIGTPLPPLEKSKDLGEFVPLWKQEVRDEKGRRRLHGAFTGGFSAGYFNSVGSKEGWAPSTFVSSRGDRAKQKQARPEDFMDEEDLQDIQDSRMLVHNEDEMDLSQKTKPDDENDDIANVLANSLAPPPSDSSGARILKKMGWRLGQGIGPRLTWAQRRVQDVAAGVPPSSLPELDDEEANKHTYAPRDTLVILTDRKDNSHGLGYRPGMRLDEERKGGKEGLNISAGFGLGALNDADEDDLDVYDKSIGSSGRHAFDIAESADDERISIGLKTDRRNRPQTFSAPRQTFSSGAMVLADFTLSDKPVAEDRWFPLPEVPPGWKPDPTRVWRQDPNKENDSRFSYETLQQHYRAGTSADERGKILGETPLPSAPRSVFDFISQKDRERIQNMATGQPSPESPFISQPEPTLYIPPVETHIAQAALTGFQPYRTDPDKQARYMLYLQHQIDSSSPVPSRLPGQAVDEFNKEMQDYKNSATLFKPMTGAMAGRFQSAAVVENAPKIPEGLHTPSISSSFLSASEPEQEKEEKELSPKENAAKMGMYGPMTRESTAWMPAKLLCKRFGVRQPEPLAEEETPTAAPSATPNTDAFISEAKLAITANGENEDESVKPMRRDLANIGLGDDESQGKDILTYERPGMDIFKAIFASDDEDSDEEKEKEEEDDEPMEVVTEPPLPPVPAPEEPVDPSTFKPTFVPRSKRAKEKEKEKDKEEKAEKKRKKKDKVLVSFDVEDGGVGLDIQPKVDRPKKKRKKDKGKEKEDDMWVEKPPPDAPVVAKPMPIKVEENGVKSEQPAGPPRGRKRAVDFL